MDDDILTNLYERVGGDYVGSYGTYCERRSRKQSSLICLLTGGVGTSYVEREVLMV